MKDNISSLRGFLPFQLLHDEEGVSLAWCDFRDVPLEAPFFIRDIVRRAFLPNPRFVTTPITALVEVAEEIPSLQPDGFIFHMSGCGSTLLANILRAVPRNISLGEPNVLYDLLGLNRTRNRDEIVTLFRAGVSTLGQKRLGIEEHYVIKFGSATTMLLPFIVEAFPEVPRVFLYRDPVEVLVSNMRTPTQEWLFEAQVTGLDNAVMTERNTALENCAAALQRTIQAFLTHSPGNHLMANYSQFSPTLIERILRFFNLSASPADMERMLSVMKTHAHTRDTPFVGDVDSKQRLASARLREVAQEYLADIYQCLESKRVRL